MSEQNEMSDAEKKARAILDNASTQLVGYLKLKGLGWGKYVNVRNGNVDVICDECVPDFPNLELVTSASYDDPCAGCGKLIERGIVGEAHGERFYELCLRIEGAAGVTLMSDECYLATMIEYYTALYIAMKMGQESEPSHISFNSYAHELAHMAMRLGYLLAQANGADIASPGAASDFTTLFGDLFDFGD